MCGVMLEAALRCAFFCVTVVSLLIGHLMSYAHTIARIARMCMQCFC